MSYELVEHRNGRVFAKYESNTPTCGGGGRYEFHRINGTDRLLFSNKEEKNKIRANTVIRAINGYGHTFYPSDKVIEFIESQGFEVVGCTGRRNPVQGDER